MTERSEIEAAMEAVLFVATDPVPKSRLFELFGKRDREKAEEALEAVLTRYRPAADRGTVAETVAGGIRIITRPELNSYLRKFFEVSGRNRLTMASLETLAIIAYRQPISGPEIQELRGVGSSGVIRTLLERRLIKISGRKQVVGKPFLYRTTRDFLMHFGLQSLDELPPLEEFEELYGAVESQDETAPESASPGEPEAL